MIIFFQFETKNFSKLFCLCTNCTQLNFWTDKNQKVFNFLNKAKKVFIFSFIILSLKTKK